MKIRVEYCETNCDTWKEGGKERAQQKGNERG